MVGWSLEEPIQGSGHSIEPDRVQGVSRELSQSCGFRHSRELDLMILIGPVQPEIFYDSMIPCHLGHDAYS